MAIQLEIMDVPEAMVLAKRATCQKEELGPIISNLFAEIMNAHPDAEGIAPPCVYYIEWREQECVIEAAFVIDPATASGSPYLKKVHGCRAVMTTHTGPYEELADAWMAFWAEVHRLGLKPAAIPPWDCYVTDPALEPDPSQWETELYIPIQDDSPETSGDALRERLLAQG